MKPLMYLALLLSFGSCTNAQTTLSGKSDVHESSLKPAAGQAIAAFAEGCFWCSEHIFEDLAGVDSAVSGYTGGHVPNPTYEQVCTETTGHAEAVMVYYDPKTISYQDLLTVFFSSHDPTTLNRQGPDVGSSYRSAIFYNNDTELELARQAIRTMSKSFKDPIVTELSPLKTFYRAEEYHQNYTEENPGSPYIKNVSIPRYENFRRSCKLKFKDDKK
jgi:peptide-methionine (S)-S-oxide reductase